MLLKRSCLVAALLCICSSAWVGAEEDSWNTDVVGRWIGGACVEVVVKDSIAYCGVPGGVIVFDCGDPTSPVELASLALPGGASGKVLAIKGQYLYVSDGYSGLRIVNISDPASPIEVGFYDTENYVQGVDVSGDYAFVGEHYAGGLRVIDVSNPAAPVAFGYGDVTHHPSDVIIVGQYAYVAGVGGGLRVMNISNPVTPVEVGAYNTDGSYGLGLTVAGDHVYLAAFTDGLRVIDVSDPTTPLEVGGYDTPFLAYDVCLNGNYAYIADVSSFRVADITDPTDPQHVTSLSSSKGLEGVVVSGDIAYVAQTHGGLKLLDVSNPAAPELIGGHATGDIAVDVAVSGNYAYVADLNEGLWVLDISDPARPLAVSHDDQYRGRDVTVREPYAYFVDSSDLKVIDISNPANPTEVGSYDMWEDVIGVDVSGDYAYVANRFDGLRVIDVSTPSNPHEVGFYDTHPVYGVAVSGNHAYVACDSSGLLVIDISTANDPREVGFYDTAGRTSGVAVSGDYAYAVEGDDGLRIIDISDPTTPFETGYYDSGDFLALDVVVIGNHAYVAYGWAGLRVIDVSDPTAPVEVAFYDTSGKALGVTVVGDHVYVADRGTGVYIIEYSPVTPTLLQSLWVKASPGEIRIVWEVEEDRDIDGYLLDRRLVDRDSWQRITPSLIPADGKSRYEFVDRGVREGERYIYQLSALTRDGDERVLGQEEAMTPAPAQLSLEQNVPNPFNPDTAIRFSLPEAAMVDISIFNAEGRRVATVFNGLLDAGVWTRRWNGINDQGQPVSSGVYMYRLRAGKQTITRKMVLLR